MYIIGYGEAVHNLPSQESSTSQPGSLQCDLKGTTAAYMTHGNQAYLLRVGRNLTDEAPHRTCT